MSMTWTLVGQVAVLALVGLFVLYGVADIATRIMKVYYTKGIEEEENERRADDLL